MTRAVDLNRAFYEELPPGREDYWRLMAAPRHRLATVLAELERRPPASVVDLGCGNGAVLREIRRHLPVLRLAGIDLSAPRIEANRGQAPGIEWLAADLDGEATFPPDWTGAFAAVVAMEIVEHLDHPATFLRTVHGLAVPGQGRLLLTTQSGPVRETERRVGHRRHWSAGEMGHLLRDTGWRPERVWNTGWPFHDFSKWWANRHPDASMARFGERAYGRSERLVCQGLRAAFRLNSRRRGVQLFAVAVAGPEP